MISKNKQFDYDKETRQHKHLTSHKEALFEKNPPLTFGIYVLLFMFKV
jgi:hypothetical protein